SAPKAPAGTAEERLQQKSTPLVRKMVEEHGLDLGAIPGTGSAGRVTKQDVLDYLEQGAPAAPSAPPAQSAAPAAPAAPAPAAAAPSRVAPAPVVEAWEGDRVEPWSKIRKLTADHMILSRRVSA